jgi:broad specificity phosphatase PhoE
MDAGRVDLVAIRHGETTLNAAGRLTGQLDPPLTAAGRAQAAALAPVAGEAYDVVVHSGSRRTADTLALARLAAGVALVAPRVDARFAERSFGALEGGPSGAWTQPADVDAAPAGGESYRALARRVVAALEDLREESAAAGGPLRVLLCSHSGVLRVLDAVAAGTLDAEALLRPGPANAGATRLAYTALTAPALVAGLRH